MGYKYFAYCSETGFDTYKTEAEARSAAEKTLEGWQEDAADNGWNEDAGNVCWGKICEQVTVRPTGNKCEFEGEMVDEYSGKLEKI